MPTAPSVATPRRRDAPIPFVRQEQATKLGKDDYVQFKLHVNMEDTTSTQYELNVAYFKGGTPEVYIRWIRDLRKILVNTKSVTVAQKFLLTRKLLQGDALAKFESAARDNGEADEEAYKKVIFALSKYVFPAKAVKLQRRAMTYQMRKPPTVTIREYVNRMVELNDYLREFPNVDPDKHLFDDSSLLAIIEYGLPNSWNKEMFRQGFDPIEHTIEEVVEMCERMEQAEPEEAKKPESAKKRPYDEARPKNPPRNRNFHKNNTKYCHFHECTGHSTAECATLNKIKSEDSNKRFKKEPKGDYDSKKPAVKKEELHAMVSDAVKRQLKKSASGKKRKPKEEVKTIEEQFDAIHVAASVDSPPDSVRSSDDASEATSSS